MIFSIIGVACLGHMATDLVAHYDRNDWLPAKPFKCDMCLTFWLSIWPLTAIYQWNGLLAAGIASILADFIFRLKQHI